MQAFVAQPFFDAAPLSLTKLEQMAEISGLSGAVISQPTGIMSLRAAERFMVQLDQRLGHPTFFLETLHNPNAPQDTSVANIALPGILTGVEAVESVARRISSILYGAQFLTQRQGKKIWLLRTAATTDYTDHWPVQQYNLEVGLRSVQQVIGRSINPCALRLSCHVPKSSLPEAWRGLPMELNRHTMGLAFHIDDLMPGLSSFAASDQPDDSANQLETDATVLRACLESFLGRSDFDRLSKRMAGAFGMSTRSYRRHLKGIGLTHRQLVADARLSKAETLLTDPSVPITEIAFELGYTHSSAFTRFFKTRTSRTPQEFRRKAAAL